MLLETQNDLYLVLWALHRVLRVVTQIEPAKSIVLPILMVILQNSANRGVSR